VTLIITKKKDSTAVNHKSSQLYSPRLIKLCHGQHKLINVNVTKINATCCEYVVWWTLGVSRLWHVIFVKIVPDMTYNVFGGTLNLALSICWSREIFLYFFDRKIACNLKTSGHILMWYLCWRGTVVERRSLAGELSLSCTCARPAADEWPVIWVNRPLQVSQLSQLSLSSFWGR